LRRLGHHHRGQDAPPAGQHQRCQRARLGAQALRVRSVLDVAAGMHAPALVEQRGADGKARVRRVGMLARGAGGGQKALQGGVVHAVASVAAPGRWRQRALLRDERCRR
jgi:hypothetical protein